MNSKFRFIEATLPQVPQNGFALLKAIEAYGVKQDSDEWIILEAIIHKALGEIAVTQLHTAILEKGERYA